MFIRQAEGGPVVTETNVVVQASTTNIVIKATGQPAPQSPAPTSAVAPEAQPNSPPAAQSSLFLDGGETSELSSTFLDPNLPASTQTGEFTLSNAVPLATGNLSDQSTTASGMSENSSKPLSPGLISAIVVCAVLVLMATVAVAFSIRRRRRDQAQDPKANDDSRSTMFWDSPPRPVMRGPSVSLQNKKHFAPPSHTYQQTVSRSNDPNRDSTVTGHNIEPPSPSSGAMLPTFTFQQHSPSPVGSPFADPSPATSMPPMAYQGHDGGVSHMPQEAMSPPVEIHNPFADPRSSWNGGMAV